MDLAGKAAFRHEAVIDRGQGKPLPQGVKARVYAQIPLITPGESPTVDQNERGKRGLSLFRQIEVHRLQGMPTIGQIEILPRNMPEERDRVLLGQVHPLGDKFGIAYCAHGVLPLFLRRRAAGD